MDEFKVQMRQWGKNQLRHGWFYYINESRYAGLEDRHQQNGIKGLTQVLSDGTNTYLYGNGRISQQATQTEYFLGDTLGSVRQLTDTAGAVTLTQSYSPYGETISSIGNGATAYQYTGEMRDANGLTYLRARYYNSSDGRFLSRDTWGGVYAPSR
jgi:RHS repeat-associated protein